jgi:hypothetical protein
MLNITNIIENDLSTYWNETDPPLSTADDKGLVFKFDEYDPKAPLCQLLLENLPDTKKFVGGKYRVEHKCRMTIFVKPYAYNTSSIDVNLVTFSNIKTEIDRIITLHVFTLPSIIQGRLDGWDDKNTIARGRGSKVSTEPIQFKSIQELTCVYYISGGF